MNLPKGFDCSLSKKRYVLSMLTRLTVQSSHGILRAGERTLRCAIGKNGTSAYKHEGDLCTPLGVFPLRVGLYRPDRVTPPPSSLLMLPLSPYDGWCDDASHPDYNQQVKLPFNARHEKLWRDDNVYDVIIPLGYNDAPVVAGAGSAIFFHLAHEDYRGTEGCVAISRDDMLWLLPQLSAETMMEIVG